MSDNRPSAWPSVLTLALVCFTVIAITWIIFE
jgi:hypothetical protein